MRIRSTTPEITFDDVLLLPRPGGFCQYEELERVSLKTKVSRNLSVDLPITSAPMPGVTTAEMAIALGKAGGLGFIHFFQPWQHQLDQAEQVKKAGVTFCATIPGADRSEVYEQVGKLLEIGTDIISVESLYAGNIETLDVIRNLRKRFPKIEVTAGVVADAAGVEALIEAGADGVRVGIGGGSHCTTRLVTAVGRPQLSAVAECSEVARKHNIPLISDTGIKHAGDIVKAIVFGADAVMIGGLLAGTDESPGEVINWEGRKVKVSYGMCTTDSIGKAVEAIDEVTEDSETDAVRAVSEGVCGHIPYRGSVAPIIKELADGVVRSMWYQSATDFAHLRENAEVVICSGSTLVETHPRVQAPSASYQEG